jgi:hypothetical protein
MNGTLVMGFLKMRDLDPTTRDLLELMAGECKKGTSSAFVRPPALMRDLDIHRATFYKAVHKAEEKGCLVVDNRGPFGWQVSLTCRQMATNDVAARRQSSNRTATGDLFKGSAKGNAKRNVRASTAGPLAKPYGLAPPSVEKVPPVQNGRAPRSGKLEPTRAASSASDLLEGLADKLAERDPAQAERVRARLAGLVPPTREGGPDDEEPF